MTICRKIWRKTSILIYLFACLLMVGCRGENDTENAPQVQQSESNQSVSQIPQFKPDAAAPANLPVDRLEQSLPKFNARAIIAEQAGLPADMRPSTPIAQISDLLIQPDQGPDYYRIEIANLDDLFALFKQLSYTRQDWLDGHREVPRLWFSGVPESWKSTSVNMPVKQKKQIFFRLMAPLVLMSNEAILADRLAIMSQGLSQASLDKLAVKYGLWKEQGPNQLYEIEDLLARVDIIPPSLALAQAAKESGWATSRFTEEGNAFFGQWDFSGKGMIPKQQRRELGNYGLKRFDSPYDSVEGYMMNINRSFAYAKFRNLRAQLRTNNQPIKGKTLATTLDKYSEQGSKYVDSIIGLIEYNHLDAIDDTYLGEHNLFHLISKATSIETE